MNKLERISKCPALKYFLLLYSSMYVLNNVPIICSILLCWLLQHFVISFKLLPTRSKNVTTKHSDDKSCKGTSHVKGLVMKRDQLCK